MTPFEHAVTHVLDVEKGFVNHPADRGGATNMGITLATLSAWRKRPVSVDDVRNLKRAEAMVIYKSMYWDVIRLDQVKNNEVAFVIFDRAVNSGGQTATLLAQQVMGHMGVNLAADGRMGPATLTALNGINAKEFCKRYLRASQLFCASICVRNPSQLAFLRGWLDRTHKVADHISVPDV